jgi:hypothetical protein
MNEKPQAQIAPERNVNPSHPSPTVTNHPSRGGSQTRPRRPHHPTHPSHPRPRHPLAQIFFRWGTARRSSATADRAGSRPTNSPPVARIIGSQVGAPALMRRKERLSAPENFSRLISRFRALCVPTLSSGSAGPKLHPMPFQNSRPVFLAKQGRNSTVRDILPARPLQVA